MHDVSSVTLHSEQKKSRKGVGGRPSKYKPEYCLQVVEFMSSGLSLTAFAASVDVSRETIEEWKRKHPEFSESCARAMAKAQAWFERKFNDNLSNREFQANACLTAMKARFTEFREASRVELSGSVTVSGVKEDDIAKAQAVLLQSQVQAPAGADQK
jgi:DNA-binding transcriptional regulator YiaG